MSDSTKITFLKVDGDTIIANVNGNPDVIAKVNSITVTHDGRIMILTDPVKPSVLYMRNVGRYDAYKDADYITLSKNDASNIIEMLKAAIWLLSSGSREDDDVEVFGDKAISYERLIDRLDGLVYPVDKIFRDQEKGFAEEYDNDVSEDGNN